MSEHPTFPAQPISGPCEHGAILAATAVTRLGIAGRLTPVQAEPATGRSSGLIVLGPHGRGMTETRDRIYAGTTNAGLPLSAQAMTISFPPSDDGDVGSEADLAVAALALAVAGRIPAAALETAVLIGEVGLDGAVRGVRGALSMVAAAARHGITTVVVPAANAAEAQLVPTVEIVVVDSLQQFVDWASTGRRPSVPTPNGAGQLSGTGKRPVGDLVHLPAAMTTARWALEVAAAGGHHLGMVVPPGACKAMLAHCQPSLLPDLDDEAACEVTALRSAAGIPTAALVRRPPLREPHHTTSDAALVGGGPHLAIPGAVSLAHHGVLFADNSATPACRSSAACWPAGTSNCAVPVAASSIRPAFSLCSPRSPAPAPTCPTRHVRPVPRRSVVAIWPGWRSSGNVPTSGCTSASPPRPIRQPGSPRPWSLRESPAPGNWPPIGGRHSASMSTPTFPARSCAPGSAACRPATSTRCYTRCEPGRGAGPGTTPGLDDQRPSRSGPTRPRRRHRRHRPAPRPAVVGPEPPHGRGPAAVHRRPRATAGAGRVQLFIRLPRGAAWTATYPPPSDGPCGRPSADLALPERYKGVRPCVPSCTSR